MKRIIILFILLWMFFTMDKRRPLSSYIQQIHSLEQKKLAASDSCFYFVEMTVNGKSNGCMARKLLLKQEEDCSQNVEDKKENPINETPVSEEPIPEQPQKGTQPEEKEPEPQGCQYVWVIDQEKIEEIGHFETVHHEAQIKKEYEYKEYIQYVFYRDDGSTEIINDYENSFNAASYFNENVEEFTRYSYSSQYIEIEKEVIVQEEYDEQVWIIDQSGQEEQGHYQEICE